MPNLRKAIKSMLGGSLLLTALLSSCGNEEPVSSSSEAEIPASSFAEEASYLASIQGNIVFDEIYKDSEGEFQKGMRCLYHDDGTVKTTGFASLSENDSSYAAGSYYYYYAESDDETYQEYIGPDNEVHKEYVDGDDGEPVAYSYYYANPFEDIPESWVYREEGYLLFAKDSYATSIASMFLNDVTDATIRFSLADDGISSFDVIGEDYSFSCEFLEKGAEVSSHHLSPFAAGEGDKTPLTQAIANALSGTYAATHYRSSQKSIVYYGAGEIVYDANADSLSATDTYYSLGDDGYMHRTVYGREEGVGPLFWDKGNYTEMSYGDDSTYAELRIRLDKVSPDLFYEKKEGEYVSVDGAAGVIFPYAQPSMNERALYTEGASKVTIIVSDGTIERIKLSYVKDAYGTGGTSVTDTIFITDIGANDPIPEVYRKSLNADSLPLSTSIVGLFTGHPDKDEDTAVTLSISSDRTTVYTVGDESYDIDHLYYYEGDEIKIAFDYTATNKRYVQLTLEDGSLTGYDSSYSDLTDFFNITLAKTA